MYNSSVNERDFSRRENKYFNLVNDEEEIKRLRSQREILGRFDSDVYKRINGKFKNPVVLDVGSNRGDFVMECFKDAGKIIGLEYDEAAVKEANAMYGNPERVKFYQMDLEADDFEKRLAICLADTGVTEIDIINMSMIVLHLKNALRVFEVLKKYLADDGILIVRDIDDGFNIAYPDTQGDFKRAIDICALNETSGFRHSGRQVYNMLKLSGYDNIILERCGLNTIGFNQFERKLLFDTYFSFIKDDLAIMHDRYPEDKTITDNYNWLQEMYPVLEQKFLDDSFFFNLGFMLFTATK